ncbi:MAG: DUF1080 domain-containing protein [Cyclobacteriaceae bacterium]|nr:DUF1080 domain-containing protein [Cyclobacteriaceae bacterium]MDH4295256.1 DUF1080 domain-containing protein [Cyclobacteriaceae bacterium]MDH5251285.1 DUF1080 domain-containing protein [Cyclobacteriaceae bacterium]
MNIRFHFSATLIFLSLLCLLSCERSGSARLFDGETFNGWEGDTVTTWKIANGAIVGGSLSETVPHNDFLCTTKAYDNFVLRLKFKLEGNGGFINAGVQFRSRRATDPAYEMIGYQADMGNNYYGALYDESRRDVVLAGPDSIAALSIIKPGDWNDYEIRAENKRIQIFLNGQQTVDYTEPGQDIPQSGIIGLQIHGGGKALVSYKDITIKEIR